MIDLDVRVARGPLRVRSLWSDEHGERFEQRLLRRRRKLLALDAVIALASLVLVVVGSLKAPHASAPSVAAAAPSPPEAAAAPSTQALGDGSTAELFGSDSHVHVDVASERRVVATLTGGARFRVVHDVKRTFQVNAGEVRVRVLGTVFSLVQLPSSQVQVLVEQGRVEVAWMGGAAVLVEGEGGTFPPADTAPAEPEAPQTGEPSRPPVSAASAHDEGVDLLQAADAARVAGRLDKALALLRGLYEGSPADRRAPVAAFTAGRILLDDMGQAAEAAAAFQRARTLWPRGPLAEDALAREAEAWQKAGRTDRARALATRYLGLYPSGRHVVTLRALEP